MLAVAEMNDAGLDVHFYADGRGAYAQSTRTGEVMRLQRVDNVFEFEAEVLPASGGSRQAYP